MSENKPNPTQPSATAVIFRRWPEADGGNLIALLPELPGNTTGTEIRCYEFGDFLSYDYEGITESTLPTGESDAAEVAALGDSLRALQVEFRVVEAATPEMHEKRRNTAREELNSFTWPTANDNEQADNFMNNDSDNQ